MNLLSSTSRVETPFVKVTIGSYTFGYMDVEIVQANKQSTYSAYRSAGIIYPNYIKSLQVKKINGTVNQYTLNIVYQITEKDDPNFFEKVFSSISKTREIIFSYGDMSVPSFMFRDEKAFLLNVTPSIDIQSSRISYTVTAVSKCILNKVGSYTFPAETIRPSERLRRLLYEENEKYGLLDVFTGMRNRTLVEKLKLIPVDDIIVDLEMKTNESVLDYMIYLVNMMTNNKQDSLKKSVYLIGYFDGGYIENGKEEINGTYFKIERCDDGAEQKDAYEIDIGYMTTNNPVIDFRAEDNQTFSLFYDYQNALNGAGYVEWINNRGEYETVYAPILSSGNSLHYTTEEEKTYWAKVTQFPVKASITLKGLIRQPVLMEYLRVNVLFYGRKYLYSGLYIITMQQDNISESGFTTTLDMVRVAGDNKPTIF